MTKAASTFMFAINDLADGHNIPSMPMGQTAEGVQLLAKAVFADEDSATTMAAFMDQKAGQVGRFEVVLVELWRPTDIEIYVRQRIRESKKDDGPKIQLLS